MTINFLPSVLLVGLLATTAGCAGRQLAAGVQAVRSEARRARDNGALRCAPRQLALADTHVEFAERELAQGDYFRARDHLQIAEDNAAAASRLSPPDKCLGAPKPADQDGDGILDRADACPREPEDRDEFEDGDGCPDPDNDKDAVADAADRCPTTAEDRDGLDDGDGCPDLDDDSDGLADAEDKCPREAEDKDGFEDTDGCPEADNDHDAVSDGNDKCPNEPGAPENDGCPKKYAHIVVTAEKIELKQKVFFETNKAAIMARSHALLAEIANVLQTRGQMRVRIEGHTDTRGTAKRNMTLSQARADAVRTHLIESGIEPGRLEAQGFGSEQPIETNKTAAGRERNRRVEFVIIQP